MEVLPEESQEGRVAGISDRGSQCSLGGDCVMEKFIQNVTEQIRCVRARTDVAKELADHITDQASAYEISGLSHDRIIQKIHASHHTKGQQDDSALPHNIVNWKHHRHHWVSGTLYAHTR